MKNSAFRRLWTAQFLSSLGDWLIVGILIPVVLQMSDGSSMAVAGIMAAKLVPALLFAALADAVAKRFNQRAIMLCSDLARMLLVLVLLLSNSLLAIYIALFLMETASQFYWPARNVMTADIVEKDSRVRANGFMYGSQRIAMVMGLVMAAAIVRGFEQAVMRVIELDITNIAQMIFDWSPLIVQSGIGHAVNVLIFAFSAALLLFVRRSSAPSSERLPPLSIRRLARDAIAPFRFLRTKPQLRTLLIALSVALVGGGAAIPVGLSYIASLKGSIPLADSLYVIYALSASRQIFMLALATIGVAIGAAIMPRLTTRLDAALLLPAFLAIFAAGMLGFAFNEQYFIAGIYAVAGGLCAAGVVLSGLNCIVRSVGEDMRARVFAATESVLRVSMLTSVVIMTPISDAISGYLRRGLGRVGIDEFLYLPLTGPRITMAISAIVVGLAAAFAFKAIYWNKRNE